MRWIITWTDALVFCLIIGFIIWFWNFKKTDEWSFIQKRIRERKRYIIAFMILIVYGIIGFLDTLHFTSMPQKSLQGSYRSVLDVLLSPRDAQSEVTYSAPFAVRAYSPEITKNEAGIVQSVYPRLQYAGLHLTNPDADRARDILIRVTKGIMIGLLLTSIFYILYRIFRKKSLRKPCLTDRKTFWITLGSILCLIGLVSVLMPEYHLLGTDKVGRDVFYMGLKSVRTGLVIGTVTLLVTLPFALLLGMWAGYFGGWMGDVIQYTYITLSAIPGVLLIAAAMLSFQGHVESEPDLRLVILCIILGVTSWTTLCRLLRGETLKLRESDFVQSAVILGARHLNIIRRHIMPNLMHIVIISVVLDFSGLVLAEAVLSYVGVGVDPTAYSWGNMINASRLEMARDPIVWWSLLGALVLMFTLVFSANIFADALQEALNPKMSQE